MIFAFWMKLAIYLAHIRCHNLSKIKNLKKRQKEKLFTQLWFNGFPVFSLLSIRKFQYYSLFSLFSWGNNTYFILLSFQLYRVQQKRKHIHWIRNIVLRIQQFVCCLYWFSLVRNNEILIIFSEYFPWF